MSDQSTAHSDERPEWWQKNQRLREEMDLPRYEPSRFEDGTYTHEVVAELEATYDCDVFFRSTYPTHPCEWEIHIDDECVATTDRRRTDRGNTIYQMSSTTFRELVEAALE